MSGDIKGLANMADYSVKYWSIKKYAFPYEMRERGFQMNIGGNDKTCPHECSPEDYGKQVGSGGNTMRFMQCQALCPLFGAEAFRLRSHVLPSLTSANKKCRCRIYLHRTMGIAMTVCCTGMHLTSM